MKIKNRPKKEKRTYEKLIETVCENWDDVVAKCPQAKRFDEDVRDFLTKAKNASTIDYRRATGFEAVMGYLYLKGDYKRMIDLIRAGLGEV